MFSFETPAAQNTFQQELEHDVTEMASGRLIEWKASQEAVEKIKADGFQAFLETLDGQQLQDSCFEGERTVCCIDERVSGCLHAAGSLILMDDASALEAVKKMDVEALTSHTGCGAMAIHYKKVNNLPDDADIDPAVLDEFAITETRALAERLGMHYAGHADQVDPGFHNARGVIIHSTPFFNSHTIDGMLPAFGVSASMLSNEDAIANAVLAAAIAQGHHGFGELFTEENPFLVIALEPEETAGTLAPLIQEVAAKAGLPVRVESGTVQAPVLEEALAA